MMNRWMDRQTDRQMDGWTEKCYSCTPATQGSHVACLAKIPHSGLGGDSVTNRWKDRGTDRGSHNILITKAWG